MNASLKNHTAFTAHTNGSSRHPTVTIEKKLNIYYESHVSMSHVMYVLVNDMESLPPW